METNKIGLITYHSAYNFGSVLQTYATVRTIESIGYEVETIDYRTPSQTFWYQNDFSISKGIRSMVDNFGFIFKKEVRNERARKFEEFIAQFLHPTKNRFTSYEEIHGAKIVKNYDILISGSDQIWNINCGEFKKEPHESILPYFLRFGRPKKKLAYASSFGSASLEKIIPYSEYLSEYDFLSTREPLTKKYMEKVLKRNVELVCDPTWLLTKEEMLELQGVYTPELSRPYILVYFLGFHPWTIGKWMGGIKKLASSNGCDIVLISPLNFFAGKGITNLYDAGPLDFLSYLANAEFVVTNTFHGTIFSMNFERPFFSCATDVTSRQGQMLEMCNLIDRIVTSPNDLVTKEIIDFSYAREIITNFRKKSQDYLFESLKFE